MGKNTEDKKERREIPAFHTYDEAQTLKELEANAKLGLSSDEAKARLEKYGLNELDKEEPESIWEKIKEQFEDLLVRLLLIAAIVSFAVSQFEEKEEHSVPSWVEPAVIFTILILNAVVGIYQDYNAEKALDALKELQSVDALVLRDGGWTQIKSKELVPGDIVQVSQGDKIPADMRLLEIKTTSLKVEQSALTGESQPVGKYPDVIKKADAVITEKLNLLFSATLVATGTAIGVVFATGMSTEIGKVQDEVDEAKKEKAEEDSPLKKRLDEFGDILAKCIGVICLIVWVVNYQNFDDPVHGGFFLGCLYYFKVAVALAVAAIPEGLPAVITTCLALGTRRMAKENAIIRKLPAVQTLGCTTVICSDKTGTLTTNEMAVREFFVFGKSASEFIESEVEGINYEPVGAVSSLNKEDFKKNKNLATFLDSMYMNNESKLLREKGRTIRTGLPTEAALKVLVEKIGKYSDDGGNAQDGENETIEKYGTKLSQNYKKLAVLEFTRDRKSMSVVCRDLKAKSNVMFIKGAPDYLLNKARSVVVSSGQIVNLSEDNKKQIAAKVNSMAKKGYRTLAICMKKECGILSDYDGPHHKAHKQLEDFDKYAALESDPILIGVVAIQDPPRPDVKGAIEACRRAGISVIMITGDIKETAQAIGKDIGILTEDEFGIKSFTGAEFDKIPEAKQKQILRNTISNVGGLIFARTEPKHKRALVKLLSGLNQIVAMTGDGVNDAPALQQADIGIAMGIAGTEVAKEASQMVLADDNFSTIVKAVEEGRAIYANMKGFIRYMISSNIGEVVSIFLSSLLGIPDGFNSIQLLWVNLVTDGLPATALSFNPPDPLIMKKPPRKHDEPIVTQWVFTRYLVIGSYVGFATVGIFVYWYTAFDWALDGHPLVTFDQLAHWSECSHWEGFKVANYGDFDFTKNPCGYFTFAKTKASTLSLTVLVIIEMFNAINALSEDSSLLQIGFWGNPLLLLACTLSVVLHCGILYIPFLQKIFGTAALDKNDWLLALAFSFPVFIFEEILKAISRGKNALEFAAEKRKHN
eukprot:CAMPEP_0176439360 /NCGR_PEP_ID=MMETSP0127-20121128/19894_1 /TAXON_ID=938130 /ORGANISM="Platyophrya macrostoma, Strain WH" /LENGTH=1040 /DNA_ID=CAMNT_0017823609 /DNA_START=27 /DNA_END=3149 /DNA_ORIENTATION=-